MIGVCDKCVRVFRSYNLFQLLAFIFGNNCHNYLNRFFFITAFSRPGSIAAIKIRNDLISYKIGVGLCYDKGICHNILIMDFVHHNAGSITENNRINSCLQTVIQCAERINSCIDQKREFSDAEIREFL